jgi:amino acid transporter
MDTLQGRRRPLKRAGLFTFVCVMYSYTTGGPFGLEDQVAASGPGMSLIYQLVLPFFWCIPISLASAELTAWMPVQGGFYRWTRLAFGDFWGFLAGWWNWCAEFLLGASYAVLFTDYLAFFIPGLNGYERYLITLALIAIVACINILGISLVGKVATVLNVVVLVPFAIMVVLSVKQWHHNPFVPVVPPGKPLFQVFGVGLALGLWLYSGYEQLTTVSGEVEGAREVFPRALAWVVPLSIATYFIPTLCSLAALDNWQSWKTGYFPEVAAQIGGRWLGLAMTAAATVMQASILNSTILASTRVPFAMAEDGYLSRGLAKLHPRFGTPAAAILLSALVCSLLAFKSLTQLISVYIWLRIPTSLLTVLCAWKQRPATEDSGSGFRIPGGKLGRFYSIGAPLLMSPFAMIASDRFALKWGPVALALGPLAWWSLKRLSPRASHDAC